MVVVFHGTTGIIIRDQDLVNFFARSNPDNLLLTFWADRLGEINNAHTWNFGYKDFSTVHPIEARKNETDPLIQGDPEASHSYVSDWKPAGFF
ncbi:hypothetical protein TR75_03020 [Hydrogenibacillus schlegelii]|uniref:Uncharacterized protein n=1 Tax=Hydrogenibacillus schlegelii TaxID=1484 RepID=A0A132NBA7_HYDSH|nr:hypothetical protein TR75_03020 [Hydrogenibacillus schlegelii]OAR05162.1 hypothetical protein SA87_08415 [Hydrogenibacillus schlegelii]